MGFPSDRLRAALSCALTLAALLIACPVAAQSADELIERGRALRQAHDDAGALALFEQAHALSPTPRALAQIGYAELALGRWVAGEAHVEAAFRETTDAWISTPDAQAAYAAVRGQIARHVSSVEIVVDVPGAEVRIGDELVGTTPLAGPVRAEVGQRTVRAHRDGYEDDSEPVIIEAGHPSRVELSLVSIPTVVVAPPTVTAPPAEGPNLGVVIGGVGLALGGASLALALAASIVVGGNNDGLAACDYGGADPCEGWRAEVRTAETLQWVGYGVGGALAVGGIVALVVGLGSSSDQPAARSFRCLPGVTGLACDARF